jgi:Domain of unknown function (DUF4386)
VSHADRALDVRAPETTSQSWVVGWGNGLVLGYLMYSSGLVPRKMAMLGLVGGPLNILSGTAVMFGLADPGGTLRAWRRSPRASGNCRSASTAR